MTTVTKYHRKNNILIKMDNISSSVLIFFTKQQKKSLKVIYASFSLYFYFHLYFNNLHMQKKWDQPSSSGGPPGVQDPKKTCNLETYLDWSARLRLFVCNEILQVSK